MSTMFITQPQPALSDQVVGQIRRLARRSRRAAVSARLAIVAVTGWVRARIGDARSDDRGLTTAEYVVLGALVVVACSAIGTAIVTFLQNHANTITKTP